MNQDKMDRERKKLGLFSVSLQEEEKESVEARTLKIYPEKSLFRGPMGSHLRSFLAPCILLNYYPGCCCCSFLYFVSSS